MAETFKPGEAAQRSGQYERGGRPWRTDRRGAHLTQGEPLPPTAAPGMGYALWT